MTDTNDPAPSADDREAQERAGRPLLVDARPLHDLVDRMAASLHAYVDVSAGVRAEFDADTADDDPRVEEAEASIARLNTRFDEAFESVLGMTSAHTGYAWDEDDDEDESDYESLQLEMLLEREGHTEEELDEALELLDSAAQSLAEMLESRGFEVPQWAVSHEQYEDDDEDEEDDEDLEGPSALPRFDAGLEEILGSEPPGTDEQDDPGETGPRGDA